MMTGQPGQQQSEAPQYSPDGRWWWDGGQWTPVRQEAAQLQSPWRWDGRRWVSLDNRFWWDGTTWQPVEVPDAIGLPRRAQGGAGQMWYQRLWPTRHRLRLAVAAAARDGDQDATATLVRQAPAHGLDAAELLAVAEAHWPKPRLHRRAWRAGRRWTVARWQRLHRPRSRVALAEPEHRP